MADPSIMELDLALEPQAAWAALSGDADHCAFLDSALPDPRRGRHSVLAWSPFLILRTRGRRIERRESGVWRSETGNPFEALGEVLARYRLAQRRGLPVPFVGGGIGYAAYDLCHFVERLPARAADDLELPELYFCFYRTALCFDHESRRWWLVGAGPDANLGRAAGEIAERLGSAPTAPAPIDLPAAAPARVAASSFERGAYVRAVQRAIEYIAAGDIFQVNLSQRFQAHWPHGGRRLYARLRALNPAPFAAWLGFDGVTIASSSPERFLMSEGGRVETRPIKGTRPRGATPAEDERLREELLSSAKDRAELTMIVDLERNDLGRVCRYGSVRVTEQLVLEQYPTVYHLVSTIVGELHTGRSLVDLLKATFPGGSITGAPKIRAMEIIDELEPTRRSVYTGSVGYIGFDGRMDLNIAIRTVILKGDTAYYQAGGGIVADSDPDLEYEETLHKARAFRWLVEGRPGEKGGGTLTD